MRNRASLLATLSLSLWASPASAGTAASVAPAIEAGSDGAAERPAVVYDKGFTLQTTDGDYALAIKGRLQSRYSYERADELGDSGVMERVGDGDLGVSRARLTLKGRATALTYKIQADFAEGFELKDFFADYRPTSSSVRLRVGRFKRPSSRQHIGSSANLDLVDRSITHKTFKNLRDTGIALHNGYEKSPQIEWVVGLFSSSAPGTVSAEEAPAVLLGDAMNPSLVARVGYNHGGIKGYREADLEGGALRFSVGLGSSVEIDGTSGDRSLTRSTADYIVKAHGFAATGALFVASKQDSSSTFSQGLDAIGGYQQIGWVLLERLHPALRYGFIDFRGPLDVDRHELTSGMALYQDGHDLKLNTEASAFFDEGADTPTYELRAQLQLVF